MIDNTMGKIDGKTFNKIPPNTKIWVGDMTDQQKEQIQLAAFASGFAWGFVHEGFKHMDQNAYYFWPDGNMCISWNKGNYYFDQNNKKEITWEDIFPEEKKPIEYLEDGCVVEYRNGMKMLYWESQKKFFMPLSEFDTINNDYLTNGTGNNDFDIVAIYRHEHPNLLHRLTVPVERMYCLWRREPKPEDVMTKDLDELCTKTFKVKTEDIAKGLVQRGWIKGDKE